MGPSCSDLRCSRLCPGLQSGLRRVGGRGPRPEARRLHGDQPDVHDRGGSASRNRPQMRPDHLPGDAHPGDQARGSRRRREPGTPRRRGRGRRDQGAAPARDGARADRGANPPSGRRESIPDRRGRPRRQPHGLTADGPGGRPVPATRGIWRRTVTLDFRTEVDHTLPEVVERDGTGTERPPGEVARHAGAGARRHPSHRGPDHRGPPA